jgi:hypothetical protein
MHLQDSIVDLKCFPDYQVIEKSMDIQKHTFFLPVLSEFQNNVRMFDILLLFSDSDGHGFAEEYGILTPSCRSLIAFKFLSSPS